MQKGADPKTSDFHSKKRGQNVPKNYQMYEKERQEGGQRNGCKKETLVLGRPRGMREARRHPLLMPNKEE